MGTMSAIFLLLLSLYILLIQSGVNALARRSQNVLAPPSREATSIEQTGFDDTALPQDYLSPSPTESPAATNSTLEDLLYALNVMQDAYFEIWQGTWPTSIDWTAAVLGTHVAATLSSVSSAVGSSSTAASTGNAQGLPSALGDDRAFENLINHFFDQISTFYFGEDAVGIRGEAYDDMMWVVLDWLENIKFQVLHSDLHYNSSWSEKTGQYWHGTQFRVPAAHRSRLFYGLASAGWDSSLCGGGMIWNPRLLPYKNAITNELYISSSIGMYLYFPGDAVESPFSARSADDDGPYRYPRNPADLKAAIDAYKWLRNSNMTGVGGMYADGFHISGWESVEQPGSRKCDELNTMVYTYNQGVILSGLRGLWLATLSQDYLSDAHELVGKVIRATGWPNTSSRTWSGLGRGGVLEDACDSTGICTQNSQAFKGIFFHHLAELCQPLRPQELRFLESHQRSGGTEDWRFAFEWHEARCRLYRPWIEHNANAALVTRNEEGKFGTWWAQPYGVSDYTVASNPLPPGAVDYRNYNGSGVLTGGERATDEIDSMYGLTNTPDQHPPAHTSADPNDRGRGRTVETQSGGVAVLRALYQWKTSPSLS